MSTLSLEEYQTQMGAFLRSPESEAAPINLDQRRAGVYRDLVFGNIESQLSASFPVIHSLFEGERWLALVREFLADYRAQTPYFTKLSEEFVDFLAQRNSDGSDPQFLVELAHYERVEIDLFMQDDEFERVFLSDEELQNKPLGLASTAKVLAYAFPVHRVGPEYQPESPLSAPTLLLLFQDGEGEVRFFELQALAYQLVQKITGGSSLSGLELLSELADEFELPFTPMFKEQGMQLLTQLNELKVLRII